MRYVVLSLLLLLACGQPEPTQTREEVPLAAPAIPPGITAKEVLVARQTRLHRRLESAERAAEGRPSEIRVAWSVALQRLEMRTGELDEKVDRMDPDAEDWEETSRALTAELDSLEKQLEAELGALQRGR